MAHAARCLAMSLTAWAAEGWKFFTYFRDQTDSEPLNEYCDKVSKSIGLISYFLLVLLAGNMEP